MFPWISGVFKRQERRAVVTEERAHTVSVVRSTMYAASGTCRTGRSAGLPAPPSSFPRRAPPRAAPSIAIVSVARPVRTCCLTTTVFLFDGNKKEAPTYLSTCLHRDGSQLLPTSQRQFFSSSRQDGLLAPGRPCSAFQSMAHVACIHFSWPDDAAHYFFPFPCSRSTGAPIDPGPPIFLFSLSSLPPAIRPG